jgi:hypothetical protein
VISYLALGEISLPYERFIPPGVEKIPRKFMDRERKNERTNELIIYIRKCVKSCEHG